MITKQSVFVNTLVSLISFAAGVGTGAVLAPEPTTAAAAVDCGDEELPPPADLPVDPARPPDYCEAFPENCNVPGECPPIIIDPITGRQTGGGCIQVEYVCCGPSSGCYAVHFAADCGEKLYWSNCEAGEQTYDPATGKAAIICHD